MRIRKGLCVAIAGSILGMQLLTIAPFGPSGRGWYWPFMNYPMYARAHYAGEVFRLYGLRAESCGPSGTVSMIGARDFGIPWFRLHYLLENSAGLRSDPPVTPVQADGATTVLTELLTEKFGRQYCRAGVVAWEFVVGQLDPSIRGTPGTPNRSWSLPAGTDEGTDMRTARP